MHARKCLGLTVETMGSHSFFVAKALKREGVDFVVAPYEADAQMALLCRIGLADFVISEDSDCIPFGCPRVSVIRLHVSDELPSEDKT